MLNWFVWNRTVYMYKTGFGIKLPRIVDMPKKTKTNQTTQNFELISDGKTWTDVLSLSFG